MLHFCKTYFKVNEVALIISNESNRDAVMGRTIKASLTNQSSEETDMATENAILFVIYCLCKLEYQNTSFNSLFFKLKQAVIGLVSLNPAQRFFSNSVSNNVVRAKLTPHTSWVGTTQEVVYGHC